VNNKPQEIQQNRGRNPDNSDPHIQLIKEVLHKYEHNKRIGNQIKEMILMKHDKQLHTEQNQSHNKDNLQRPAFLSLGRGHCEYLTGPRPSCIPLRRHSVRGCQVRLGLGNGPGIGNMGEVEGLGQDLVVVDVGEQVGLELLFVAGVVLVFQFFCDYKEGYIRSPGCVILARFGPRLLIARSLVIALCCPFTSKYGPTVIGLRRGRISGFRRNWR